MNEKRFRVNDLVKFNYSEVGEYVDENHTPIPLRNDEVCKLLNEQQDIIQSLQKDIMEISDGHQSYIEMDSETHSKINDIIHTQRRKIFRLEKENEKLRQMIKENVFQRYREGSLSDLEFKAIAYDDIIKVEFNNSKVIVYCNYGKKENVKSLCQMFIPFGISYEIKEMINDGE